MKFMNKYAVVTSYSWGEMPSVEIFEAESEALNYIEQIKNECKEDVDENGNKTEFEKIDEGRYALTVYRDSGKVDKIWLETTNDIYLQEKIFIVQCMSPIEKAWEIAAVDIKEARAKWREIVPHDESFSFLKDGPQFWRIFEEEVDYYIMAKTNRDGGLVYV